MPKGEKRYPKPDEARKLFMDSPHYSWREFTISQGWDTEGSRRRYPVPKWIAEKIALQNETFGAEIDAMMSEQSEHWYREVSRTLREYPQMIDSTAQIVKYRNNQYLKVIQQDLKNGTDEFRKIPTSEIRHLSVAVRQITEAKYHSLMLSEMKVKEFERAATGEGKIVFEIAGGGDVKNIKKIMEEWNNK